MCVWFCKSLFPFLGCEPLKGRGLPLVQCCIPAAKESILLNKELVTECVVKASANSFAGSLTACAVQGPVLTPWGGKLGTWHWKQEGGPGDT